MRTHRAVFIALATLVAAISACRTPASKGESGGTGAARAMEGRVEKVGRHDGTVTLRAGEERRQLLVAPEAEIRLDDFKGTFEDLEEGQRVRASFEEVDGQTEGFRIEILDQGVKAPEASGESGGADGSPTPEAGNDSR